MVVRDRLSRYRRKRDFTATREPSGARARKRARPSGKPHFVVHLHHARARHFDLRLQVGDVLRSWAVPKGPSLDPRTKRLAVEVEDHPLAYEHFEGVIPEGQYGAGTVSIWDEGEWSPEGDPRKALRDGHLRFVLRGHRLQGGWSLIRTPRKARQPQWLLIKSHDEAERPGDEADDTPLSEWSQSSRGRGSRRSNYGKRTRPRAAPAQQRSERTSVSATHGLPATEVSGVRLTHPDRILFKDPQITKRELAAFYRDIAAFILPGLRNRPQMLLRCPDGASGECFFQKHITPGFPPAVHAVRDRALKQSWIYIDDLAGLVSLVQMNTLEFHVWGCTRADLEHADRIVIDLDPGPDVPWKQVIEAALALHERLTAGRLQSFVRTTGGKGLHVVIPLAPAAAWDAVAGFARALAEACAGERPERYVAVASKNRRPGRIFIDYLRNARGATAVCSYSLRNRPGAPIATPLDWDELPKVKSGDAFRFANIGRRLARLSTDPWASIDRVHQSLPRA
jgi:bifunctional non-homologous end joining protein LigD